MKKIICENLIFFVGGPKMPEALKQTVPIWQFFRLWIVSTSLGLRYRKLQSLSKLQPTQNKFHLHKSKNHEEHNLLSSTIW